MLAFYYGQETDRIPMATYDFLVPRGRTERELREKGLGLIKWCSVSPLISPAFLGMGGQVKDVEVSLKEMWENGEKLTVRTFQTPKGSVFEIYRADPAYGSMWIKKHLIERKEDYSVLQFIVENSLVSDNRESILETQDDLGQDGVVLGMVDRTPFQKVMWEMTGPERIFLDLYDDPEPVEALLQAVEMKMDETYALAAEGPAEVIWSPDNITGDLNSPDFFKKYHLPHYSRRAKLLHQNNKSYIVHMDGIIKSLIKLVNQTDVDVVESFSLPLAGGNLPIKDALEAWPDKSIAANVPASLCFQDEGTIRAFVDELLSDLDGRKNFMLQVSEDLPHKFWKIGLPVILDALIQGQNH
jgi:hypothetical protein